MQLFDLHTHSTLCDGKNTLEEMVIGAINKGLTALGFSPHSYTSFDTVYCLKDENAYYGEAVRLREKYKDKIKILIGMETDFYSQKSSLPLDYTIGSVHYLLKNGVYYPLDNTVAELQSCIAAFGGNQAFTEAYYAAVEEMFSKHKPDIVGHLDLITKFINAERQVVITDENYYRVAEKTIDALCRQSALFEINTGVVFRGFKKEFYPDNRIMEMLRARNARLILSGDAHSVAGIAFAFDSVKIDEENR